MSRGTRCKIPGCWIRSSKDLLGLILLACWWSSSSCGYAIGFASCRQSLSAPRSSARTKHFGLLLLSKDNLDESISSPEPVASVDALDDMIPRSKIAALSSRSNRQGMLQVSFHFGMLGLAAATATVKLLSSLSLLFTAFVSSFYFCGLHECVHRTAFRSRQLNDGMAHLFGILTLRPASHYRFYHWQHHKYTGNVELDSELQKGSLLDLPVDTPLSYLWYLSGIPFWMDAMWTILQHALYQCPEPYLQSPRARRQVGAEARVYLVLYGALALAGAFRPALRAALLCYWIVPAILGQPFLRFYLLGEHRGRVTSTWIVENTRTIHDTPWWYRKLGWNMPYHMEHHAWPSVPFWRLQDVHKLVREAGGIEVLDRGEIYPELGMQGGRKGYLDLNWRFWSLLVRQQRAKSSITK